MDTKTRKLMAENMEEFSNHAYDVASAFIALNGKHSNYIDDIEYYSNSDIVYITYDVSWRGCHDIESIQMPIEYLWEDGWEEKAHICIETDKKKAKLEAERKEIRDKEEQVKAKEERAKAKEKKDKADYERLKQKFEGDGS